VQFSLIPSHGREGIKQYRESTRRFSITILMAQLRNCSIGLGKMKKYSLPPGWAVSFITLVSIGLWFTIWEIVAR
jgi:hypothetical protein